MLIKDLLLSEGIEDKGIFKALFFAGIPGAGKSYTINKVQDGSIQPRIVNTDRFLEYYGKKSLIGLDTDDKAEFVWNSYETKISTLNKNSLHHYLNSMLPLIIDSTSVSPTNLLMRVGILESLGYDTALVFLDTDLDLALERNNKRSRRVPDEFIRDSHKLIKKTESFYHSKFKHFFKINNETGILDNDDFENAFKKTRSFFNSPIDNPIGNDNIEKMRENKWKYLVPDMISKSDLASKIDLWYHK